MGLVDPEDAFDLDLFALDVETLDVEGLGHDVIGRDNDVLAQGEGGAFEDLGLVRAVCDEGDNARSGLAEDGVRLLGLGRGIGRGQGQGAYQDHTRFA